MNETFQSTKAVFYSEWRNTRVSSQRSRKRCTSLKIVTNWTYILKHGVDSVAILITLGMIKCCGWYASLYSLGPEINCAIEIVATWDKQSRAGHLFAPGCSYPNFLPSTLKEVNAVRAGVAITFMSGLERFLKTHNAWSTSILPQKSWYKNFKTFDGMKAIVFVFNLSERTSTSLAVI